MSAPLAIGTVVEPWGKIAAVGVTGGERYYWLVGVTEADESCVSMIPATLVEANAATGPIEETT